jgi:hypothetical protein
MRLAVGGCSQEELLPLEAAHMLVGASMRVVAVVEEGRVAKLRAVMH